MNEPTSERRPASVALEPATRPAPAGAPGVRPGAPGHTGAPPPSSRGKRTWLWVLILLIGLGALVWWLTHRGGQGQGGAQGAGGHGGHGAHGGMANMPTTVSVAQATRGNVPIYLNELGAVTPLATVTVQSQIAGYLQQIAFKEGQMVQKGQFLEQIDPRPYQAALLQAQGALARDQAALSEAQLDLKRYQILLSQDSIARQQVDVQAATVQQDEGTVKTDEAAIATAKLNITYTHIVSPVTGRVGLRQVDVGNYVTSGMTNGLVVVTQLAPIDVEFTLPEDNLPQVVARERTGASLQAVAYDRTGATQLAQGQLLTLDNVIDPTTGTIKAKARFDNGAGNLFPQQFVNIRLLVDTLSNTVVVPTSAVLRGPNGLFVYVVKGGQNNHTTTVRNVKTGPAAGEVTAITDGLQVGETVVTDGTDRLQEGSKVILPGDCIPTAPSGGKGGHHGHGGGQGYGGGQGAGQAGQGGRGACPAGQRQARAGGQQTAAAGSAPASPDQPGPGGGAAGGSGAGGRTQAMMAQLNLDAQQQLKAQAIFTKARGEAMTAAANAGDDPDAQRQARQQAYAQAFAELEPILRPDQKTKLEAMRAQMAAHGGHGGNQGGGAQGGGAQGGGAQGGAQ